MERNLLFIPNEYYHVYNRGVNKAPIFFNNSDWNHFQKLLYTRNSTQRIDSTLVKGVPFHKIQRGNTIVDIVAYVQMPNHFHLILHEKIDSGISTFMGKLATAYSMYINAKYERSGPLMCRPFRAKHIDSDDYFRWCMSYVHANPLELKTTPDESLLLKSYKYSSYVDYFLPARNESLILNKDILPFNAKELESIEAMKELSKTIEL